MLTLVPVSKRDLPDGSTHGFRLEVVDHPEQTLFFHWHDKPVEEVLRYDLSLHDPDNLPAEVDFTETVARQHTTSYADVLKVLPDRLLAFGLETDIDAIMGEIIDMFGAG